jgi:hypothetical protein
LCLPDQVVTIIGSAGAQQWQPDSIPAVGTSNRLSPVGIQIRQLLKAPNVEGSKRETKPSAQGEKQRTEANEGKREPIVRLTNFLSEGWLNHKFWSVVISFA